MVHSYARPIDDQEVASLIPAGDGIFFYDNDLPSADSRRAGVSSWWNNVYKYWLTVYTKPAQEKCG